MKSAAAALAKWKSGMANSGEAVRAGVNAVTESPATKAVANQAAMRARLLASIDNGKWAANLGKVTAAAWKQAMLDKGVSRMQDGAAKGEKKMGDFLNQFLPFVATLQAQIHAMPNVTDSDRENRMLANVRGLRQFQKQ